MTRGASAGTRCPVCETDTGVQRERGPGVLAGYLSLDEFQVLVRNEWRRRLGPPAYGRAHPVLVVRLLAEMASQGPTPDRERRFTREVDRLAAALVVGGRERADVRWEVHQLLRAARLVLERAGVGEGAVRTFMAGALRAVRRALAYPSGV